jgi:hypothetical protein
MLKVDSFMYLEALEDDFRVILCETRNRDSVPVQARWASIIARRASTHVLAKNPDLHSSLSEQLTSG